MEGAIEAAMSGLVVEELVKVFSGREVVSGLSFFVRPGEIVGLLGPNGAGKSTAFYMAIGLVRPDKGRVIFFDKDVTGYAVHKRARLGMGYLAQEPSVFRELSVEENILLVLETLPLSKGEQRERLERLLDELHLKPLRKKRAETLSGGERRRLEITRALVMEPKILLLDEPFANIDPISVQEVKGLVSHLAKRGIGVLICDHNAREIFSIVDRCYLVCDGKVLVSGTPGALVEHEDAKRLYLGQGFLL